MKYENQHDLKEDVYYYRNAIKTWYSFISLYDPKDPSKAAPYLQVRYLQRQCRLYKSLNANKQAFFR